jgi:hypothetical protein
MDKICCPIFNPEPWNDQEIFWENKRFVQDRVTSIFHIPLNFGAVMERCDKLIREACAATDTRIVLADENSLWGADVYIEVSKDIPHARMISLSGNFLSRVYEGSYQHMRHWIEDMQSYVESRGKVLTKLYFYYTTCPKCAKKYGKNYVVLLAQVQSA